MCNESECIPMRSQKQSRIKSGLKENQESKQKLTHESPEYKGREHCRAKFWE